MKEVSPKTEKDIDDLLKKIKASTGLTQEEIAVEIGYSRPYLSQAKKTDSSKLYDALISKFESELIKVRNLTPNEEPKKDLSERSLDNLTESNKVLAEANRTLAEANKTLAEANHVISKNHDELIQLTKMIVGIHGKPSKKEDLREKTKKPTHS